MEILIELWNGQRFISGPRLGNTVANIADFNAINYNGLAVYAYTVDMDSKNDTRNDRELFIQVYDFTTHKTYRHIRLTDDSLTDALPQLVRSGSGEEAMTTLFWYRDDKQVAYINLSTLIKDHIADNGSLLLKKKDTDPEKDGEAITREDLYSYISLPTDNKSGNQAMSDFKAVTDDHNIFIVWTRPCMDSADPGRQCRELYATALVRKSDSFGSNWANPYRLTKAGKIVDEPEVAIDGDGRLIAMYNQYEQEITEDPENPVLLKNMQFRASILNPCGDVDVTGIALSKALPRAGEKIRLVVNVTNNGLTRTENGYTVVIREKKGGVLRDEIGTLSSSNKLLPGNTDSYELEWTVPEDFAGVSIYAEAVEMGYADVSEYETEALKAMPYYEITDERVYLAEDGYHIAGTLANKGNAPSQETDKLNLTITGPYNMSINYTPEQKTLLDAGMGVVLEPEEKMSFDRVLTCNDPGVFHRFGFIDCLAQMSRVNNEKDPEWENNPLLKDTPNVTDLSDAVSMRIMAQKPSDYKLNGNELSKSITLEEGETLPLEISCTPGTLNPTLTPSFTAEDTNIARIEDGALVAVSAGSTILSGVVMPYGDRLEDVEIIVRGKGSPDTPDVPQPFVDVEASQYFYDAVLWALANKVTNGTSDTTFSPDASCTRGQVVTFLWRAAGRPASNISVPFTDINKDAYYYDACKWAVENGITNGTSADKFSPNQTITRAQMATFLHRYAKKTESFGKTTFKDVYAGAYYAEAVQWAASSGIISGTSDSTFSPNAACTRGQTVTFLYRLFH